MGHIANTTYIIAEMACSHEGEPALARAIIDGAGRAGADAVQFQIWTLADMMVRHNPVYEEVEALELSHKDWTELAAHTRSAWPDMQIIACVSERGSVDFAESLNADAYKIHASDLSNPDLVRQVAATGRRIDLSVGASTLEEIAAALGWIAESPATETWLMYGYQLFPTPVAALNLALMPPLRTRFGCRVGYQDHTDADTPDAFWIPASALGMGIDILEKHITHDRAKKGADHESALNPDEFAAFVAMVREIEQARGSGARGPFSDEEERYRVYSKKSLVAGRDLPAGHVIAEADLIALRAPDLGLPPARQAELVGRALKHDVCAQHLVLPEDVE